MASPTKSPSQRTVSSSDGSDGNPKQLAGPQMAKITTASAAEPDVDSQGEGDMEIVPQKHNKLLGWLLSSKIVPIPSERQPSPKDRANFFSHMTWGWLTPLIRTGYNRILEINDIPLPSKRETNDARVAEYRKKLERYAETEQKTGKRVPYRELRAAAYAMRWRFFLTLGFVSFYIATELSVTVVSKHLIAEVELLYAGTKHNHGRAVSYAIGNTILSIAFQWLLTWFGYETRYFAELARTMLISSIFDKVTRLSPRGRQQFPPSKITSIITTDTNRIFMAARWTPVVVVFFPAFGAMIGLLWSYIGIACLPGCGLVLIGLIFNLILSRFITRLRQKSIPFADKRIAAIRETVENMRIIKFYGWELSFVDLISKARFREASFLKRLALVEGFADATTTSMPFFAGLLAFSVRTILGGGLNPALVFPSLTVFQLYIPLTMIFTAGVNTHADAWASVKRLNDFFLADEESSYLIKASPESPIAVDISHGGFKWDVAEPPKDQVKRNRRLWRYLKAGFTRQDESMATPAGFNNQAGAGISDELEYVEEKTNDVAKRDLSRAGAKKFPGLLDVNLQIKRGEMIMVVGSIGSGKTSLLSVIVGNITKDAGSVTVAGTTSSVLSTWSQNNTIRNNILFGNEYDAQKYAEIVRVCSLESDFAQFPSRDFVEVGERGITLSGGQKARISLARCVYNGGDIILLDDVLSAVDGKVAAHIFDQCIDGYLKSATRIMSTHNLKLLPRADRVVFMDGHGHARIGTLQELIDNDPVFKDMYLKGINAADSSSSDDDGSEITEDDLAEDADKEHDMDEDVELITRVKSSGVVSLKRQLSRAPANADAKLMQEEHRQRGRMENRIILEYLRSGSKIGLWFCGVIIFFQAFVATAATMQTVFLNFWSSDRYHKSNGFYIGMYAVVMSCRALGYLCLAVSVAVFCFSSSSKLHNTAVENLYRAPISYFDSTPLGRIINRFTDDTANLDTQLYMVLRMFLFSSSMLLGSLIVIFVYIPYIIIALVPVVFSALVFLSYYRSGSREIKRINSLFRSKMFSLVTETISGLPVILSYGRAQTYRSDLNERIDDMNSSFALATGAQYWMALRVVLTTAIIVFLTVMLSVFQVFDLPPASVATLISLLPSVSISLAMALPLFAELENQGNSVERLYELGHDIPQEAAYHIEGTTPPPSWPDAGVIEFVDASLRYRPELPDVLKNITMRFNKGEKVGIIGRTGAGKSTIMSALFRVNELSGGKIIIDNVDISTLGLDDLRQKLAIIPQEPVLFQGTIRFNLDPFNHSTDVELWDALRRSGVIRENEIVSGQVDSDHKFHLDTKIDADGTNLSLGERQLLTLARALVRQARIIALDEATAAVDFETDRMIQETIAREFGDCTILSIAHRLQTIVNYDKVVVMDAGEIKEMGHPYDLYKNVNSVFRQMAQDSGLGEDDFRQSKAT